VGVERTLFKTPNPREGRGVILAKLKLLSVKKNVWGTRRERKMNGGGRKTPTRRLLAETLPTSGEGGKS